MVAIWETRIQFCEQAPPIREIQERLSWKTGLEIDWIDKTQAHDISGGFAYPEFDYVVEFYVDGNTFVICPGMRSRSYLQWALLDTVIELGGIYKSDKPVPHWAKKTWKERKWWQFLR
jgi:hypothetical protein